MKKDHGLDREQNPDRDQSAKEGSTTWSWSERWGRNPKMELGVLSGKGE
ncbi:MAG: hypothetical protein QMC95_14955 [Desulfitobacteriaceae bacterium]|nr:hypothetical protein [Desulfitobacteriaceae bacterium]MDI6915493.1 hypothetical protein [Desulfitobacteriaceae bacterium]